MTTAELNIPAADVESLLVSLILDSKITGHIDQVMVFLVFSSRCLCVAREPSTTAPNPYLNVDFPHLRWDVKYFDRLATSMYITSARNCDVYLHLP